VPTHSSSPSSEAPTTSALLTPASPLAPSPSKRQPLSEPAASPPQPASPARPKTGLGALCSSSTSHVLERIQLLQARNEEGLPLPLPLTPRLTLTLTLTLTPTLALTLTTDPTPTSNCRRATRRARV